MAHQLLQAGDIKKEYIYKKTVFNNYNSGITAKSKFKSALPEVIGIINMTLKENINFIEGNIDKGIIFIKDNKGKRERKIQNIKLCVEEMIKLSNNSYGYKTILCSEKYIINKTIKNDESITVKEHTFLLPQRKWKINESLQLHIYSGSDKEVDINRGLITHLASKKYYKLDYKQAVEYLK